MRRALWILVPSLVVIAAYRIAAHIFPEHWGGPNIGGGLILVLAYVGVVTGLVRLAIAWRQRSQERL